MSGDKPGNTPLSRVISVNMKLGKLISSIADGVQKFGNLQIPIDWNKDGKAVKFQKMTTADIQSAANNIVYIVSTIGNALMESYNDHQDWYKEPESLMGKIFGGGSNAKKTPFGIVVSTNLRLAELVSNIGKAVGNIAKLTVPIEWNKDGKAVKFETLNEKHFTMAGDNIATIISTLGEAIMKQYDDPKKASWWKDEDGDLLKAGKNPFSIVMKSTKGMSEVIKNIALGIKDFSKLMIPIEWDKEGKPIKYREMTNEDFLNAAVNISLIITTIGDSIMKAFENKDWFNGEGIFGGGDSKFTKILNGCISMAEMISSISTGITSLAQLMIPTAWDKEGKPIEFRQMTSDDFTNAATSVETIISTVGQALIKTYDSRHELFKTSEDNPDSVFAKVAQSCASMGEMIANIAEGVSSLADIEATMKAKGIKFDGDTYTQAANNIAKVVTVIGDALMTTFNDKKEWFNNPPIVTKKDGFLGIGGSTEIKPDNSDTPFNKVIKGCTLMGGMIMSIAEGIAFFATITQNPLPNGEMMNIEQAKTNIGSIITTIGDAIIKVANSSSFHDISKIEPIISGVQKASTAVSGVADLLSKIGTGKMPITDKDGKVLYYLLINDTSIKKAAETIGLIISGVSEGLDKANTNMQNYKYNMYDPNSAKRMNEILDNINKAISIVGTNAKILGQLAEGRIRIFNDKGEQIDEIIFGGEKTITTAGTIIKDIITTLAKGISEACQTEYIKDTSNNDKILNSINKSIEIISKNAKLLAELANGKIENIVIKPETFKSSAGIISDIMTTVANGIKTASDKLANVFGDESYEKSTPAKMFKALEGAKSTVANMALFLGNLSRNRFEYIDDVTGKKTSISITSDGMKTSSQLLGDIISSITDGINSGIDNIYSTKDRLENLKELNLVASIYPVIQEIQKSFNALNSIGNSPEVVVKPVVTVGFAEQQTPLQGFLSDVDSIIKQAFDIANAPIDKSYNTLRNVIDATNTTMTNFHLPDNFSQQTESLDKFIKSVNSIKIEGVDSLTELLRELNKLGVNMGNMDKLTDAISKKLSVTLQNMGKSMDALNKTMIEDGKRKQKHEQQIKSSVSKIREVMNQKMEVIVKMDESSNSNSISGSENDTDKKSGGNSKDIKG